MKVLSTSVPIFTRDIEAAIERYEALTRETVRERFEVHEQGIEIAPLGSLTIIAGPKKTYRRAQKPPRDVHRRLACRVRRAFALDGRNDSSGSKPDASWHKHDCSRRRGCGV
jgi:hypothetical protein